ncbi:hypothetical protein BDD12DRAFT_348140 [Trichophaea hybrida]|nr:hypothetical protein BDD12DRAFT_348140 [Trichophaea hybrida]
MCCRSVFSFDLIFRIMSFLTIAHILLSDVTAQEHDSQPTLLEDGYSVHLLLTCHCLARDLAVSRIVIFFSYSPYNPNPVGIS